MGGLSIWHWLIVLVIVVVIFGTKRLTGGAKDLGSAVKEFKKAMKDDASAKVTDPLHPAIDPSKQAAIDPTRVQDGSAVAPGDTTPRD